MDLIKNRNEVQLGALLSEVNWAITNYWNYYTDNLNTAKNYDHPLSNSYRNRMEHNADIYFRTYNRLKQFRDKIIAELQWREHKQEILHLLACKKGVGELEYQETGAASTLWAQFSYKDNQYGGGYLQLIYMIDGRVENFAGDYDTPGDRNVEVTEVIFEEFKYFNGEDDLVLDLNQDQINEISKEAEHYLALQLDGIHQEIISESYE